MSESQISTTAIQATSSGALDGLNLRALGAGCIRLLEIQPGQPHEPISVKLIHARTSDQPSYEALSYTWGDTSEKEQIQILLERESGPIAGWVTQNCHAALKRLRLKIESPRVVWIDSICINQADLEERNRQISLMTQIYKGARRVVVHLGEPTESSGKVMDYLREVDEANAYGESQTTHSGVSQPDASDFAAFFARPWFNRVWVLQEMQMATDAVVYCGDRELSWASVKTFKRWSVSTFRYKSLPYVVTAQPGRYDYLDFPSRLLVELNDTRHCDATDPRDKLFAILPLILQSQDKDTDKEGLKIDYKKSAVQVFIDLAKYLFREKGYGVLRYCSTSASALPGLPSWAPDWSAKGREVSSDDLYKWATREEEDTKPDVLEYVSTDGIVKYGLPAEGLRCGSIVAVGELCDLESNIFPLLQWKALMLDSSVTGRSSLDEEHEIDIFFHVLFGAARRISGDFDLLQVLESRVAAYNSGLEARPERSTQDLSDGSRLDTDEELSLVDFCSSGLPRSWSVKLRGILKSRCDSRRLFITDTGFVGLVASDCAIGESVLFTLGRYGYGFLVRDRSEQDWQLNTPHKGGLETKKDVQASLVGDCVVYRALCEGFDRADIVIF